MDTQDIRRAVLRALIKRNHNNVVRQFAAAIQKPDGQINDMLSTPPRKSFGERVARAIEKSYNLDPGYLDSLENSEIDTNNYERLVQRAQQAKAPSPKVIYGQFNSLISEVIELMGTVDEETQRDILGAVRLACSEYRMKIQNSIQRAGQ